MINFLRRIRQRLLVEGKLSQYLGYSVGEIVLVVIGILIALQINNWNEGRKSRKREVQYLSNLRADLKDELNNNAEFLSFHLGKAETASRLIGIAPPETAEEAGEYINRYELIFYWNSFVPNNNTFKELLSSGSLSLITNDSIKTGLLELDKLHQRISIVEHHMRREFEIYLYDEAVLHTSALPLLPTEVPDQGLMLHRIDAGKLPESGKEKIIRDTRWLNSSQTFTNGLRLALMNNAALAEEHRNAASHVRDLIGKIDRELAE